MLFDMEALVDDVSRDSSFGRRRLLLLLLLLCRKSTGCSMLRGHSQCDVKIDTASAEGRSVASSMTSLSRVGTASGSSQISMTAITLQATVPLLS